MDASRAASGQTVLQPVFRRGYPITFHITYGELSGG